MRRQPSAVASRSKAAAICRVIGDYTRVSGLADLQEKIISGRFCVDRQGRNVELASRGMAFVVDDARERREWSEDQEVLMEFLRSQTEGVR